ncbi:MAG: hypothetical protein ABJF50_20530 [Paracoccaceae bacterium]|uniref:hypothetical protein n=1 Tax=Alphaproteobacteria TaxID=28211 RepID=UPI0032926B74
MEPLFEGSTENGGAYNITSQETTITFADGSSFSVNTNGLITDDPAGFHQYDSLVRIDYNAFDFINTGVRPGQSYFSEAGWADQNVTAEHVFIGLTEEAAPDFFDGFGNPVSTGSQTLVTGMNPVVHIVDPDSMTVVNITEPGHVFHDGIWGGGPENEGGIVVRRVIVTEEGIFLQSIGVGVGENAWVNNLVGATTFDLNTRVAIMDNAYKHAVIRDLIDTGNECFGAGTPVDMWPLDKSLKPGPNGVYDQELVRAKIWQKPIEDVSIGDLVVSFDNAGNLVPGHVPRTFQNEVKILLNFFGTRVTPGHVYYRADSKKAHKFETLIDVLRDDGVIQHQDGTLIRAATNVPVGDPRDGYVKAATGTRRSDGSLDEKDQGRIRLGTRFIMGEGKQRKHWSIADVIEHAGGVVGDDEMIRVGDGPPMAFHWEFGDTLPKPEDFVLEASGTTLEDIYKAAEWEGQQPQMPAPMVMDGGPIQPLPHAALKAMPRNEPQNVAHSEMAATKPQ